MKIENKKQVVRLKKLFFLVSVLIALTALVLFFLDYTIYGISMAGVFALWFLYFQVADYQYIFFSNENHKIILRYYKAVKLGRPAYNSIEFPQNILQNAYFENSIFGKRSDLTIVIRSRRGMAEYPSISLTGLTVEERSRIEAAFNEILRMN